MRPPDKRRGRGKTVCARGAWVLLLGGPSTSPLDAAEVSVVAGSVASRKLWAECPKRGGFEIELRIGVPYPVSDVEWACPVGLSGLHDRLRDQHGIDSWQVLMLAQRLARTLLQAFVEDGGRLSDTRGGKVVSVAGLFDGGS